MCNNAESLYFSVFPPFQTSGVFAHTHTRLGEGVLYVASPVIENSEMAGESEGIWCCCPLFIGWVSVCEGS